MKSEKGGTSWKGNDGTRKCSVQEQMELWWFVCVCQIRGNIRRQSEMGSIALSSEKMIRKFLDFITKSPNYYFSKNHFRDFPFQYLQVSYEMKKKQFPEEYNQKVDY